MKNFIILLLSLSLCSTIANSTKSGLTGVVAHLILNGDGEVVPGKGNPEIVCAGSELIQDKFFVDNKHMNVILHCRACCAKNKYETWTFTKDSKCICPENSSETHDKALDSWDN